MDVIAENAREGLMNEILFADELVVMSGSTENLKIVRIGNSTNEKATESDLKATVNCTCGNGKMRGQERRKCKDCVRCTCNQTKTLPLLPFEKRS